jgi:hypothetical protein
MRQKIIGVLHYPSASLVRVMMPTMIAIYRLRKN